MEKRNSYLIHYCTGVFDKMAWNRNKTVIRIAVRAKTCTSHIQIILLTERYLFACARHQVAFLHGMVPKHSKTMTYTFRMLYFGWLSHSNTRISFRYDGGRGQRFYSRCLSCFLHHHCANHCRFPFISQLELSQFVCSASIVVGNSLPSPNSFIHTPPPLLPYPHFLCPSHLSQFPLLVVSFMAGYISPWDATAKVCR